MKVALTGATGFIGKYVREELQICGHEVVLLVRDANKLGFVTDNEKVLDADIKDNRRNWFADLGSPDALLHLAWGGLPNYMDDYHLKVELPYQTKFLQNVIRCGLKKLIVTGTCYEYGISSGAISESQETMPNTPYGIAKDRLRQELFRIQSQQKYHLTWCRIFFPYGDGQSNSSLYSQIKKAINEKEFVFELGNSESILDFIPVEIVGEILAGLTLKLDGVGIVNLGTGQGTSVLKFAQHQTQKSQREINFWSNPLISREYESTKFWADTKILNQLLAKLKTENTEF